MARPSNLKQCILETQSHRDFMALVPVMERETAWQQGFASGRLEGARRAVRIVGTTKFGKPDRASAKRIDSMDDFEALIQIALRVLDVDDWEKLLGV